MKVKRHNVRKVSKNEEINPNFAFETLFWMDDLIHWVGGVN